MASLFKVSTRKKSAASGSSQSGRAGSSNLPNGQGTGSRQFDGAGGGTVSQTEYAKRCKAIMQLYQDLKPLTNHHLPQFQFPKVVVIGGQSTGKSSLVEAVSGIKVPREAGTCTRCPMECTMTAADTWSCDVQIEWTHAPDGHPLPFTERRFESFGSTITNPRQMELWIRRAQAAILSQGYRPSSDFRSMTGDQLKEEKEIDDPRRLSFSKNVIRVHLRDPEATELSFVDLPGLVQNVGSRELVDLVAELVKSSIADEDTLILVAVPMTEDIEGQGAVSMAKDADPDGSRIIGVLTKPDMLTEGSVGSKERWTHILNNQDSTHRLQHGYYCVRLLDDAQRLRNIGRAEAQRIGEVFFNTTEPWKSMTNRSRFGIPNLIKTLSALLIERIEAKLPQLMRTVKKALRDTQKDLDSLPSRFSFGDTTPSAEVLLRVSNFCREFGLVVDGKEDDKSFVRGNRGVYQGFQQEILSTGPNFCPTTSSSAYPVNPSNPSCSRQEPIDLIAVRVVIAECTGWELPGITPYDATKRLIERHVKQWAVPSRRCFSSVASNTTNALGELLEKHFGQFPYLKAYLRETAVGLQRQTEESAKRILEKCIEAETGPFYTGNVSLYLSEEAKWQASYIEMARQRQLGVTTTYSEEIAVMSKVQAYFQVASNRYVDDIPLSIEHELNQALASGLQASLVKKVFEAIDKGTLDDLLVEDENVARQRAELQDRLDKLKMIMSKLEEFGDCVEFDWEGSEVAPESYPTDSSLSCVQ